MHTKVHTHNSTLIYKSKKNIVICRVFQTTWKPPLPLFGDRNIPNVHSRERKAIIDGPFGRLVDSEKIWRHTKVVGEALLCALEECEGVL